MKLDYIPTEEELAELLAAGVTFTEELLDNGYLFVNWQCVNKMDWKRTLYMVKNSIPKLGRKFDSDTKCWLIAPDYIPTFNYIKSIIQAPTNEEFVDIDSDIEDDIVANILGVEFRQLPPTMRQKAYFVFDTYIQIQSGIAPANTMLQYCLSENIWGAYNHEAGVWWYSNGRYSSHSPKEKDKKASDNAILKLKKQADRLQTDMGYLNSDAIYLPSLKEIFRRNMLDKYDHQCYTCGRKPKNKSKLHMHRVIPGKNGGEYVESNVVILCTKCHRPFEGATWDEIHMAHSQLIGE